MFDYGVLLLLFRLKVFDDYNDEEVEVTRKELKLVRRLLKGKAPHADFDPYAVCSFHSCHAPTYMDINFEFLQIIYIILCLKFNFEFLQIIYIILFQMQPYVDWFKWDDAKHPLSNAPEPKRRFIPSKWESKKVRSPRVCVDSL
jgi:ribosome biogenesis protein ERB1